MKSLAGLIHYLLENGYAEPKRGYGHVAASELAQALVDDGWVELDTDKEGFDEYRELGGEGG